MKVKVAPADQRKQKAYHTRDCGKLPENPREMDIEAAKSFGYTECGHCAGVDIGTADRSYYNALLEAANE